MRPTCILIFVLFTCGCMHAGSTVGSVTSSLDTICVPSEKLAPGMFKMPTIRAAAAGTIRQQRAMLLTSPGSVGPGFCTIDLRGVVDSKLLVSILDTWGRTRGIVLKDATSPFSGDDGTTGMRTAWGGEAERLVVYVYSPAAPDGTAARIMYDAG